MHKVMTNSTIPKPTLKLVNRCLVVLIIGINLYLVAAPLWPQIQFWFVKRRSSPTNNLPYKTVLPKEKSKNNVRASVPVDNRLVIPSMAYNQPILSGKDPNTVNKGVWNRPESSTPPQGSNTVLAGHRFSYAGRPSLYHLDVVKIKDNIVVYWQQHEYDYQVSEIKEVPATATEIEGSTTNSQLTIYTCTPLWNVKNRLVVIARLIPKEVTYE